MRMNQGIQERSSISPATESPRIDCSLEKLDRFGEQSMRMDQGIQRREQSIRIRNSDWAAWNLLHLQKRNP
jgi:hypothetical protein